MVTVSAGFATPFTALSDEAFQKQLANQERYLSQQQQLSNLNNKYTTYRTKLGEGTSESAFGGSANNSSNNNSNTSSLFGGGTLDSYTDRAKDLARFRLGLDQEQATFSSGLRETEAQNNFGREYKLVDQQFQGQTGLKNVDFGHNYKLADQQGQIQTGLETLRQDATTNRLQRQLDSQQGMQKSGFDQQNLFRAQSAALALRGLR